VGFWGGPGHGRKAIDAAKKEKLPLKTRIAQDDQSQANPAAFEGATERKSLCYGAFPPEHPSETPFQQNEHVRDNAVMDFWRQTGSALAGSYLTTFNQNRRSCR